MKPQTQEQQQEIERQTNELRKRLYPFFGNAKAEDIFYTVLSLSAVVVFSVFLWFYSHTNDSLLNIIFVLGNIVLLIVPACIWINRLWFTDSVDRELEKNISARELITRFKEGRERHANRATLMTVGLLCWSVSILIGIFELHVLIFIGWCISIAISCFSYRHYLRSEKMARQLVEQISD